VPPPADSRPARAGFWLYAGHLFTVFGIALSNILLGLTLLTSPWTGRGRASSLRRASPLLTALALYAGFTLVSMIFSYEPALSFGAWGEFFNVTGLPLALLLVRGERGVRRVVDGLILVGGVVAVAGLAQVLGGYGGIENRIRGPFSHYMTFAGFLLVVDLLLLAAMLCGDAWRRWWSWPALLAINLALVGSLTRSAWVGLGVAATLMILLRAPRLLVAYLPASLLIVLLAPVPVLHRIGSIVDLADRSNYDRLCMADAGLHMIAERPLFGLGPNLVEERYPIYRPASAPRFQTPHLHNSFLQLAAERGLLSLAAYLAMVGITAAAAWRAYRREGGLAGPRADLHLGALLALVAFNLAGLFENNWGDTEVQRLVLFVLAMPFCLEAGEERDEPAAPLPAPEV
jgi:O-antigen ligase